MSSSRQRRPLYLLLAALALLGIGGLLFLRSYPGSAPGHGEKQVSYEVRRGVGANRVSQELAELGIVKSADYFKLYLRLTGRSDRLKVGVYDLDDGMTAEEVAGVLIEGRVRLYAITIPEGWHNRQIGDYLAQKGYVRDRAEFLKLAGDPAVLRKWGIPDTSTEGYLFPDTYMVPKGYSAAAIQEVMLKRFFEVLQEISGKRELTPEVRDRVVLASIVEREAVRPEERPLMARVFLNRLDKRMRLESCATIQYLFERQRKKIYDKDLEIDSPYNTYRNAGLPPGPISNPGRAALRAAFQPEATDYLFFLVKPDGSHHFATTYRDHINAKKKYIDSPNTPIDEP